MDTKGSVDRFWLELSQPLALGHPGRSVAKIQTDFERID